MGLNNNASGFAAGAFKSGAAAIGASSPVALPSDTIVGAAASIAALNTDLLTGTVSGWFDASNYKSASIELIGAAGISAGAVTIEQTNDTTNAAAGVPLPYNDLTLAAGTLAVGAVTVPASTVKALGVTILSRYIRVRVSTAFAGGTIQAVASFSQQPYSR